MQIDPREVPWQLLHKIMLGSILPRPIGWVSTVSPDGRPNLAPFSFFNAICANPPHVFFSSGIRGVDRSPKDTLRNIQATGDFVVNIVSEALAEAMNISATEFPPEVNEFEAAGLTAAASSIVRPPRVLESPVQYECRLTQIVTLGEGPGSASAVIGEVVYLHIRDEVLIGEDKIDLDKLRPIGRLSGSWYTRVADRFELRRPPSQITPPSS